MGAAKDFVAATFADAIAPTLRRPVEDIIYETLDRRQVPTRTDFKELRDLLNVLRGQVSGATQGAKKLAETLEDIDALTVQLETQTKRQDSAITELQKSLLDSQTQMTGFLARLTLIEKAQSGSEEKIKETIERYLTQNPGIEQTNSLFCKVAGCNEKSRAKGFCAKHYQKWRRGTLSGYVNHEGQILHQGQTLHIGDQHAGEPYESRDDGLYFKGSLLTELT